MMASVTPPASSRRRKRYRPSISSSHRTASFSISPPRHEPSWQPGKDVEKRAVGQCIGVERSRLGSLGGGGCITGHSSACTFIPVVCTQLFRGLPAGKYPAWRRWGGGAGKKAQARSTLQ